MDEEGLPEEERVGSWEILRKADLTLSAPHCRSNKY